MSPIILMIAVLLLLSCKDTDNQFSSSSSVRLDTLAKGLSVPWGIAFLPNGEILFTERAGEVKKWHSGKITTLTGVPKVYASGQGGMLDIVLHPKYTQNQWIYFTYSQSAQSGEKGNGSSTVVARARLSGNALTQWQQLFKASPNYTASHHYGSRLAFDASGYLYVSIGERGQWDKAQQLDNHAGKVIRLYDDGRVPPDNPFVNVPGALPEIFSIGHRNPQGMALNPFTNEIWAHEHGPKGGDELNIIRKGRNYGWPVVTFGINYDGTIISPDTAKAGMEQPIIYWTPSIAPSGMAFITSNKYSGWKGNLIIGALSHKKIVRCELSGQRVIRQEILFEGLARIRDVRQGPDGYIYLLTEGPGMILRIMPK